MKIVDVKAVVLRAPWKPGADGTIPEHLARPSSNFSVFARTGQFSVLVLITSDDGITGVGEGYGLPSPEPTAQIVRELLAPSLLGNDPLAIGRIWRTMMALPRGMGMNRGFLMHAISAIDIALWDLKSRALELSLARLLGGEETAEVDCYASPIPHLPTPEESQDAARSYLADGFHAMKLKVGRGVAVDIEHVTAVRDVLPSGARLMLDCNCAYSIRGAIEFVRALKDIDIFWLEEPLAPDDYEGLADVRRRASTAIATGENEFTAAGLRNAFTLRAADVVMPNVTRAGGITGLLKIAEAADLYGVEVAPHGVGSVIAQAATLHAMVAIPAALTYEYNRFPNPLRDGDGRTPMLVNGRLVPPAGFGHGGGDLVTNLNEYADHPFMSPPAPSRIARQGTESKPL